MNGFTLQETSAAYGTTTFVVLDPSGMECGWITVRDKFVSVLLDEAWNHKVERPMMRKKPKPKRYRL